MTFIFHDTRHRQMARTIKWSNQENLKLQLVFEAAYFYFMAEGILSVLHVQLIISS